MELAIIMNLGVMMFMLVSYCFYCFYFISWFEFDPTLITYQIFFSELIDKVNILILIF